ncbi:MAG: X-Pro dipeptidyl-peptidase [Gaiellaceae bacterium]|nr:MAG: X-Pro dipeptidyl-peptidase [Gaiellaceae bacterium]
MTSSGAAYDVRLLHDQRATLRDGLSLSADVYLPLARGPFPTIVQWTPYESTRDRFIAWGVFYAERGYAAVVLDVRGRYESDGEFTAYRRDGEDAFDSLDWVASREWCNGRIGTWGRSYGAIVQWQLAPHRHPAVACMAPHVIMDDYFADCHYVGGAFQLALSLGAALIWSTSIGVVTGENAGRLMLNDRVLRHLPLLELDEQAIGRRVACWREWLAHSVDDGFWRSLRHRPEDVTVPVFQQCGWYDAYPGATMRTFQALAGRVPQKVLMGPWSHEEEFTRVIGGHDFGPEASRVIREDDLRWYDQWLKELDTGILDEPPLSLFVMGANRWRHESEWPLPGTELTPWYLHSGGRANSLAGDGVLSPEPPGAGEPADTYDYDPARPVPTIGGNNSILTMMQNAVEPIVPGPADQRPLERRDDVLCYTSAPLERDLEVTGPVEAVLYAASSARDTDFTVRLSDVQPDGRSLVLCEGIVRARHRTGLDRVELLEPGEVAEYRIRMYPTSNLFRRGHRLRVDVSSSSFPRFSRNLNTGEDIATGTRMEIARQTVLHTDAYPSHVLLPIVPS